MKIQQRILSGLRRSLSAVFISLAIFESAPPVQAGNLPWEIWALSGYASIQDLTNSGTLNNTPDAVFTIVNTFDTFNVGNTDDHADDYSSRVRGFLQVPESGTYQLFLSSAEESQLSVSTDSDPDNLVLVAQETNSGAALFSGARLDQRTSPPLNLVKGQSYYFEVLHTAADSGSDWIRVGWQTPESLQQIIPALYLLPWSPDSTTPVVSDEPADTNVVEGNSIILNTTVQALEPATFQWYKDGQAIAGENVQSLVIAEAYPTNAGQYYLQVTDANNNTASSSTAKVGVQLDTTPPTLVTTELNAKSNLFTVVFSEKLNPASATNLDNYSLNNGVTLSSGTVAADQLTVTFNVSGLTPGQSNFQLSVSSVADRFGNSISSVTVPVDLVWTETFSGGPGYFTAAINNHTNGNNFDYSFSINAGGSVGELGGTFVRTTTASAGYLADPTLGGAISLSNNVVIRGQIFIHNIAANGNFFFGFTSTNGFGSSLGIQLAEPGSGFQPNFRGQAIANGTSSAKYPVAPEVVVPFDLSWNAAAGVLTANVGSQTFYSTNTSAVTRTYSNFVIAALGANSIIQADQVLLYFDNLTYSVGSVRAAPIATGTTVGATLQQPVNGQVFAQGSTIPLLAQALTAGQPVSKVEFYQRSGSGGSGVKISEITNSASTNISFASVWNGATLGNYNLTARATTTDSLTATSSPVSIYVVAPQALTDVVEPFATGLDRFQTQINSQAAGNNFGFSDTGNAGGAAAGEAGGLFVRSTSPAYLADTNLGALYPEIEDLDLSGQLYLQNNNWNGTAFIGYVNSTNLNVRFGININEPSSGSTFRGSVVFGAASSVTIDLNPGAPIAFSLHWSSSSETVTGTVAGQPVSLPYAPLTEFFDTLGIGTFGNGTTDATAQVSLFADDLNYTTVGAVPKLNIRLVNGQAVLSWTASGFKLQQSGSLGAGVSWSDDASTVNLGGGVSTVTETPPASTSFWRLAPQ